MKINPKIGILEGNRPNYNPINRNQFYFTFFPKHVGNEPLRKLDIPSFLNHLQKAMLDGQPKFSIEELTPEIVRRFYWEEKKSLPEIARIFDISYSEKIRRLMLKSGIPLRSRAEGVRIKRKKLKIGKEELYELYWKKGMKLEAIGKLLGVTGQTILRELKRYEISRRTYSEARVIQRREISPEELRLLYFKGKMSLEKLARYVGTRSSTIKKMLIAEGISLREAGESLIKHERKPFSEDEIEKSYLIGVRIGDLYVKKDGKTIVVALGSTHLSMLTLFYDMFSKYGFCRKIPRKSKLGYGYEWGVTCYLDESFEFLLDKTHVIVPTKKELFLSFLAGYADAEGCWKMSKRKRGYIEFRFDLETQDVETLTQIKMMLERLGFTPKFYLIKEKGERIGPFTLRKSMYRISICKRKEVIELGGLLLPFIKHSEKERKVKLILDSKEKIRYEDVEDKIKVFKSEIKGEVLECVKKAEIAYLSKNSGGVM